MGMYKRFRAEIIFARIRTGRQVPVSDEIQITGKPKFSPKEN